MDARVWGRVIHPPEVLAAVPEIHLQAQWLNAHREELPAITPALEPYWDNATVRPILEAVKRCKRVGEMKGREGERGAL